VPANHMFPNTALHLTGCYRGDGLDLYPLGEVIDCDCVKLYLSLSQWKWSLDVYTPSAKRPRGPHMMHLFRGCVENGLVLLTFPTFVSKCLGILLDRWPVVSGPENSYCHGPSTLVHTAYALMELG